MGAFKAGIVVDSFGAISETADSDAAKTWMALAILAANVGAIISNFHSDLFYSHVLW